MTSMCHELKLVQTLFKASGAARKLTSLGISAVHHQTKSTITWNAIMMRENIKSFAFADMENKFLVLHLDWKIIQCIIGYTGELLAIAISILNFIFGQFLALPSIQNGKELIVISSVYDIDSEYAYLSEVESMFFDTTASNTGVWKGSVTLFKKKFN